MIRVSANVGRTSATVRMSANSTLWKPEPIARIAWWVYWVCSILIMPVRLASSSARPRLSGSCRLKGAYSAENSM